MNPEIKKKWVEALRSGEYEQTEGQLRVDDEKGKPVGYCCLGVLCEVMGAKYIPTRGRADAEKDAGLHEDDGFKLACMNDDGRSFREIADYIEANL